MKILVTRPLHQAEAAAKALTGRGHSCVLQPLLDIQALNKPVPRELFNGIVLTSSNAVPALNDLGTMSQVPILTTGRASALVVERDGYANVNYVEGSALDLVAHVPMWMSQHKLNDNLLYPCAESPAHNLTELLAAHNINCVQWPVYRAVPSSRFTPQTKRALQDQKIDAVLLYSKRIAHTFVQLMRQDEIPMNSLRAYVMSSDIFNALPEELQNRAHYPTKPIEDDLLNLIGR